MLPNHPKKHRVFRTLNAVESVSLRPFNGGIKKVVFHESQYATYAHKFHMYNKIERDRDTYNIPRIYIYIHERESIYIYTIH